ncbi:MAG: ATP-binding cassette domain-containing protein [Candidatus Micrarchaeia archaeon]
MKKFKDFVAVDKITFKVHSGEIFGLLGPNGAGKTTTIKMLTTLIETTSGTANVAGYNIRKQKGLVRKNIGIVFQDPSLDDKLTGKENLVFHGLLYGLDNKIMEQRISSVLKLVELEDKKDILVENYSGGMKRRLEIARGLMHQPKVIFLDEPTVGLDPQTRRKIWDYITELNKKHKTTIILTTHYIEEADFLCNRVAFIDRGRIVALDTPEKLKDNMGGDIITLRVNGAVDKTVFRNIKFIKSIKILNNAIELTVDEGETKMISILDLAKKNNLKVYSVSLRKPSLEDVFIKITKSTIREEGGSSKDKMRMMRGRMR